MEVMRERKKFFNSFEYRDPPPGSQPGPRGKELGAPCQSAASLSLPAYKVVVSALPWN